MRYVPHGAMGVYAHPLPLSVPDITRPRPPHTRHTTIVRKHPISQTPLPLLFESSPVHVSSRSTGPSMPYHSYAPPLSSFFLPALLPNLLFCLAPFSGSSHLTSVSLPFAGVWRRLHQEETRSTQKPLSRRHLYLYRLPGALSRHRISCAHGMCDRVGCLSPQLLGLTILSRAA